MEESRALDAGDNNMAGHARAEPRDSLFLQAVIRRGGHDSLALRVRNLSASGLMAQSAEPFLQGDPVELDLRGIGAVSGRIAWAMGGRIGIVFDRLVDPKLARRPVGGAVAMDALPSRVTSALQRRPGLRIG